MKKYLLAAAAAAALLTACGGGGSSDSQTNTKVSVTSVKVVGASLADSGTFGYKFTVQPAGSTTYPVYSERIASAYGMSSFCPFYTYVSSGSSFASHSGCTNYAVAGAAVNNYDMTARAVLDTIPTSAIKQLVDLGNAGFASTDLLIVGEASANDTASLTSAYVQQTFYAAFSTADFTTLLATLVSASDMTAYASDPTTLGTLYMQALADKLVAAVKTNALDKGAPRIAILNTLDVTMTPKFQAMLTSIAQATNAATAMSVQAMVNGWIQAYNARLASDIAAYSSKIVIVDFYTNFTAEFTAPAQHGLTNTMATVCDEIVTGGAAPGATSLDTPAVVGACTDAAASAMGSPANWWMSFLFADNFHPPPYGHQLLGQLVTNRLTEVGWL